MFLGAGSVMHGTNDDVDMRHYGALRKLMPVTFLTFAHGLPGDHRLPRASPASGPRTRSSRPRSTQNVWLGVCAAIGAGVTGFYMTRLMLMTFFGEQRWEPDVHPHESPKVMTGPAGRAGGAVGVRRADAPERLDRRLPQPGRRHSSAARSRVIPSLAMSAIIVVIVAVGVGIAWMLFARRAVPRVAPQKVSVFTTAGRNELYGDAFNDAVIVGPGEELTDGLVAFDGTRGRRRLRRHRRRAERSVGPAPAGPERLRPLLRALRARWRRPRPPCRRGGEPDMTIPWLTILWVLPVVGSVLVAALPRRAAAAGSQADRPRLLAWSRSCSPAGSRSTTASTSTAASASSPRRSTGSSCSAPTTRWASTASASRWCCSPRS